MEASTQNISAVSGVLSCVNNKYLHPHPPPITTRFGRPTRSRRRRSSLKKKLTTPPQFPLKHSHPIPLDNNNNNNPASDSNFPNPTTTSTGSESKGDSVLWDKLENWVEQYKRDVEYWGVGTHPIFTVFQDTLGNVVRVSVDEDEILRRCGIHPPDRHFQPQPQHVTSKISHAYFIASEIQSGRHLLVPNANTCVSKTVILDHQQHFFTTIINKSIPNFIPPKHSSATASRVGAAVVCGFLFVWVVKKLFTYQTADITRLDKELLRRKIKSRVERGKLKEIGSCSSSIVEVVEEAESDSHAQRPQLDKEELLNNIRNAKIFNNEFAVVDHGPKPSHPDMNAKIQMMARRPRQIDKAGDFSSMEQDQSVHDDISSNEEPHLVEEAINDKIQIGELKTRSSDSLRATVEIDTVEVLARGLNKHSNGVIKHQEPGNTEKNFSNKIEDREQHMKDSLESSNLTPSYERIPSLVRRNPKIILSVKEAREYLTLSAHHQKQPPMAGVNDKTDNHMSQQPREGSSGVDKRLLEPVQLQGANIGQSKGVRQNVSLSVDINGLNEEAHIRSTPNTSYDPRGAERSVNEVCKHGKSNKTSDEILGETTFHDAQEYLPTLENLDKMHERFEPAEPTIHGQVLDLVPDDSASIEVGTCDETSTILDDIEEAHIAKEKLLDMADGVYQTPASGTSVSVTADAYDVHDPSSKEYVGKNENDFKKNDVLSPDKEKWLEKNFHEVEPIVMKIGAGFRNNYMFAREKRIQEDLGSDILRLSSIKDDTELEWMQDDKLRDVVFRVRDNELAGRDPFHSMDLEDKNCFLKGLESKVEKQNQKLSILHEWLHSNIENIDYGADGISLYDPPDKVIPRWKGPPLDKIPEFLNNSAALKVASSSSSIQEVNESLQHDNIEMSCANSRCDEAVGISKTVIEASSGSIKPGKKSGKEYWQRTKKWSRGFLESYNAETDPEVKSVMKDMGKGLDRWITEEEIQEAADLMDRIPQRGKDYIEKKLNKLKREMEQFGPAAVVSKYREYAEEKEEDYLWWLDLRYVLCIELYIYEVEDQRIGFYSLEMATDLELDPKPRHVIAFEDPSDCKNFCYIIQSHLEMLGSGLAFAVAQPPKDVFYQAKANGFGVTVIRKAEIQLNVDQPLEEVEELIIEIGSKMYHDKITQGRSVDINSLMKGVFGISKPTKRRRKRLARKRLGKN